MGWLFLDIIATFPFGLILNSDRGTVVKLIRLVRLPRILKIFSYDRVKKLNNFVNRRASRQGKVKGQLLARTYFALFTMLLLAFFCSYFLGAIFYFMSQELNTIEDEERGFTFIKANNLDSRSEFFRCITMTYYMMTTLTAIGYGDMGAVSNTEKIICMLLFFGG
jgi:hypothetical protein